MRWPLIGILIKFYIQGHLLRGISAIEKYYIGSNILYSNILFLLIEII